MPHRANLATVQTYREHAARLTAHANSTRDPAARAEFTELAQHWERLSALAEWQATAAAPAP